MNKTLKEAVADWADIDCAAYELALCLGLMPPSPLGAFGEAKFVFWTVNPIGNMLHQFLDAMVEAGILEERDGPQYRWNPVFKGSWESK